MGGTADIERLLVLGLDRYGAGDVEGARDAWQQAIALDPNNEAAAGYLRWLHEASARRSGAGASPSEPLVSEAPRAVDGGEHLDTGWDDEAPAGPAPVAPASTAASRPSAFAHVEHNFEDSTQVFHGIPRRPTEPGSDSDAVTAQLQLRRPAGSRSGAAVAGELTVASVGQAPGAGAAEELPVVSSAPTRELGIRDGLIPPPAPVNVDRGAGSVPAVAPAHELRPPARVPAGPGPASARQPEGRPDSPRRAGATQQDLASPIDPLVARSAQILEEIDAGAPAGEARDEQTRRRVTTLLERASQWADGGDLERAAAAAELALSEDPNSVLGQKLIARHSATISALFQRFLGDLGRMPRMSRPIHELANIPLGPRAAFLLSRIDGSLTIEEILDVSGMPRLETLRHLTHLFQRGVLR